jgi:uncharacterized protein
VRVVFDTNIFISALIFPGSQAEKAIVRIIEEDTLVTSPEIIKEVLAVLARKFSRDREELARVAVNLADLALVVNPERRLDILRDEPDNSILECAVAGSCDLVVTGGREMLELGEFEGVRVVSLRDYLQSSWK